MTLYDFQSLLNYSIINISEIKLVGEVIENNISLTLKKAVKLFGKRSIIEENLYE